MILKVIWSSLVNLTTMVNLPLWCISSSGQLTKIMHKSGSNGWVLAANDLSYMGLGCWVVATTFIKETPTYQESTYHNTKAFYNRFLTAISFNSWYHFIAVLFHCICVFHIIAAEYLLYHWWYLFYFIAGIYVISLLIPISFHCWCIFHIIVVGYHSFHCQCLFHCRCLFYCS